MELYRLSRQQARLLLPATVHMMVQNPHNTFASAVTIPLNTQINGTISSPTG